MTGLLSEDFMRGGKREGAGRHKRELSVQEILEKGPHLSAYTVRQRADVRVRFIMAILFASTKRPTRKQPMGLHAFAMGHHKRGPKNKGINLGGVNARKLVAAYDKSCSLFPQCSGLEWRHRIVSGIAKHNVDIGRLAPLVEPATVRAALRILARRDQPFHNEG